jgi:hypothetical protein
MRCQSGRAVLLFVAEVVQEFGTETDNLIAFEKLIWNSLVHGLSSEEV